MMTIEKIGQFVDSGKIENLNSRSIESSVPLESENESKEIEAKSFGALLEETINKANEVQLQADRAIKELAAGKNKNIHETMLMIEKADASFKLMMQVRNKVIDAYREIMRMQV
jgi:flagellar hook-basal body complex protein FliE